jgi:hypothetical protein
MVYSVRNSPGTVLGQFQSRLWALTFRHERFDSMGFADDWGKVYNKSILAFTGRKKVAVRELEDVVKGTSPLVKSLVVLDQNDPSTGSEKEKSAKHKAFVAEQKNFVKAAEKYGAILDGALKKTDKDMWPEAHQELKVLRKELDALTSKVDARATATSKEYTQAQQKVGAAITKTTEKLRAKGLDDMEIREETNYLKQQRMLVSWPKLTKAAITRAVSAVQKVKADSSAATYNAAMLDGGRDLSQQFVNLIKLVQDKKCPQEVKDLMDGLPGFRPTLTEFGDGAKRQIDGAATKNQVTAQIKEFADLTKAMVPYYDKMEKYLKKHKL